MRFNHLVLISTIALFFLISGSLLQTMGWRYVGGGSSIEKIHPATYLLVAAFLFSFAVDAQFRSTVFTNVSSDFSLMSFIVAIAAAAGYAILVKGSSIAPFVDTLGMLVLVTVIFISLPQKPLQMFRVWIDAFFMVNICVILAEYALRRNFIPVYTGETIYTGELLTDLNRPAGLFGHPLSAAVLLGTYAISNLFSTPARLSINYAFRIFLSFVSLMALSTTGSRSPLTVTVVVLVLFFVFSSLKTVASGFVNRAALGWILISTAALILIVPAIYQMGVFDLMLLRFEHDNGSSLTREFALQMLWNARPEDLWIGLPIAEVAALQQSFGVLAIEISWVNYVLICGLIFTVPLFSSYCLFWFRSIPRYCVPAIYLLSISNVVVTIFSNSLWTKSTGFAAGTAMIISFLRRDIVPWRSDAVNRRPSRISRRVDQPV